MSRPRHYWYVTVNKMVKNYPCLKKDNSIQAGIFLNAINKSISEIKAFDNGVDRVKAVEAVCLKQTDTVESISYKMNYSDRTVQNWINSFIRLVGKNAGF